MPRRTLSALFILLLCCLAAHAQEGGKKDAAREPKTGMVYGKDLAFFITAPGGWVLDNESGVRQGLHAVFYPEGSSWQESKAVMYANAAPKGGADTLEKFIEGDVEKFRENSPALSVTDDAPLPVDGKERVLVRRFSGGNPPNFEAVAYVEEEKSVVMIVLSARTRKDFDDALPAFRRLVSSYRFLADKVKTGN
jgi:hypothetical protein